MPRFYSLRDIAKELQEPFHRVRYAITEGGIEPTQRVGMLRLFTVEQLPLIREALAKSSRRELAHA